jgi:hypothetical protein
MLCQLSYIHRQHLIPAGVPHMARLEGIEPPTDGLEIRCSIQLSYRRKRKAPPTREVGLARPETTRPRFAGDRHAHSRHAWPTPA